jgi:hypothetical protein
METYNLPLWITLGRPNCDKSRAYQVEFRGVENLIDFEDFFSMSFSALSFVVFRVQDFPKLGKKRIHENKRFSIVFCSPKGNAAHKKHPRAIFSRAF